MEPKVIFTLDHEVHIDPESVVQNDPQINVDVVYDQDVHHNTVVILKVFVCLVVFIKHPVREEVHAERNEAYT